MSDCEETDFFWDSWIWPGKRKRKKDSRKGCKNDITMKTDETPKKKKKKNSKFKEVMTRRKAKKKDKKKKKNRLALELNDIFMQASSAQANPVVKPETSNAHRNDRLKPDQLTQDCKTKRKKKVAFDLSPGYICVKRPKFVSSSPQCPKEIILFENEAVQDSESCSQVTVTGHSQRPTQDNDSQYTSEDINSQDLFITQKTFRASSPEPSSGEASDKAFTAASQLFTQQGMLHTSVAQRKQHLEGSYSCPGDSHVHQHLKKTNEHAKKPKTVLLTEDEEGVNKKHKQKNGKISLQTQMELNANLSEEKKTLSPVPIKPSVNHFLAEPIVVTPSPVAKSKKHSYTSSQQSMTSTSTQTENFFTNELSSYLNFCQKRRVSAHLEDLKPLDLSLSQRARKDLGTCLSVKMSSLLGQIKGDNHKDPNLHPSCSSDMKDVQVKKEAPRHKSETILSFQSESEPKSADTTASSEDNEPPCRTGKLDLTQVRQPVTLPTVHCSYTGSCSQQISCISVSAQAAIFRPVSSFCLGIQSHLFVKCSLQKRKDT